LDDAEERLLYSQKYRDEMVGLAYDSFLEELSTFDHLPYYDRAAYFALVNPDRRLFQYFTVFHRAAFEQRFPFYDYDYFKFVYALPPEMLFQRRLRRGIVLDRMKSLSRIPYDKDNLPVTSSQLMRILYKVNNSTRSYVNRQIKPIFPERLTLYADYENWLRRELKDWGEQILLGDENRSREYFDPNFLQSIWNRHQSGLEVNMIGKFAPIMTFEMLLRKFYRDGKPDVMEPEVRELDESVEESEQIEEEPALHDADVLGGDVSQNE
jgi:hypothetical protein